MILPCKICAQPSTCFGMVDYNKNCCEQTGLQLPKTGLNVHYMRCRECGFIFTNYFDHYSISDFQTHIYNDEYHLVDPPYAEARPQANATFLKQVLTKSWQKDCCHIVDYGAGQGRLSELMFPHYKVSNYDPMNAEYNQLPAHTADMVFCSEVLEHAVNPQDILKDWVRLIGNGFVLFSTMLQPDNIEEIGVDWWYIAPRNGHVSLFTKASMKRLLASAGFQYVSLSDEWHLALKGESEALHIDSLQHVVQQLPTGFIEM